MLNTNLVVFKGRKDGIVILLDDKISFEELKDIYKEKVVDASKFFGGRKTPIIFQGRELSEEQESELLQIISSEANVNISFFRSDQTGGAPPPPAAAQVAVMETMSVPYLENLSKLNSYEQCAIFNTGSLRSGQAVNFPGTVVVLGDINPGAEVVAGGNIIVLGAAKGFVYAGSTGNPSSFIFATDLSPVQLRIADIITVIPKEDHTAKKFLRRIKKAASPVPSMAYISEGQIYIVQV